MSVRPSVSPWFCIKTNKEIVDSRLRPQSQWSRGKSAFLSLAYARPCDLSVGFPTFRHCLFTNNCHAHWHAIGEIRSGHEILARDWSARIIYAWQTYRQTDCNTSLPLAGEVTKPALQYFTDGEIIQFERSRLTRSMHLYLCLTVFVIWVHMARSDRERKPTGIIQTVLWKFNSPCHVQSKIKVVGLHIIRAAVGIGFQFPYPSHAHINLEKPIGNPHGIPIPTEPRNPP